MADDPFIIPEEGKDVDTRILIRKIYIDTELAFSIFLLLNTDDLFPLRIVYSNCVVTCLEDLEV